MRLKKVFVLFLTLVISGVSGIYKSSFAQKSPKTQLETNKSVNNRLIKLQSDSNWIKLGQIWKQLNSAKAEKEFDTNKNKFEQLMASKDQMESYLGNLTKSKLLTAEEKLFLQDFFKQRYELLKFRLVIIPCYAPFPPRGENPESAAMDLEGRYKTLQKLASENKINSETYKTTVSQIDKDLKIINKGTDKKNNTQLVDLLYYLSK